MTTPRHRRDVPPRPETASSSRYGALDGLRGIAAFAVVLYHVTLVVPAVAAVYVGGKSPATGSAEWWLYRTPLRVLFAGHEAVLLFFVLSGFVLTLPILSAQRAGRRFGWRAYYPRRLARLYVPVWGALVVALLLALVVARDTKVDGLWLASHKAPTAQRTAKDAFLLVGTSNLDSPLWSLRWEMWFSLLLPVLFGLLVVLRARRWAPLAAAVLIGLSVAGQFPRTTEHLPLARLSAGLLQYIPVFVLGMLMAINRDALRELGRRVNTTTRPGRWWALLTVVAVLGVWAPSAVGDRGRFGAGEAVGYVASVVGVCLLLLVALEAAGARTALLSRPVQWAGTRSFSMYLVHEPIVVAVALRVRPHGYLPWLLIAIPTVAGALLATELFYRGVERPAHLFSRWIGRRAAPTPPVSSPPVFPTASGPDALSYSE